MKEGSNTRSSLLWEVKRLILELKELPQVLLLENVPQIHSQANMPDFQKWIDFLESKGYSNYWQDLCASDYGVAQRRGRTYVASILGEYNYKFPKPIPLEKTMKDYLEDEVDEKYYINTEKAQKLIQQLIDNGTLQEHNLDRQTDRQSDIALTCQLMSQDKSQLQTALKQNMMQESATLKQTEAELLKVNEVGFIERGTGKHQSNTVYSKNGLSPCVQAVNYKEPIKVLE